MIVKIVGVDWYHLKFYYKYKYIKENVLILTNPKKYIKKSEKHQPPPYGVCQFEIRMKKHI